MKKIKFDRVRTYRYCQLTFQSQSDYEKAIVILSTIKSEDLIVAKDISSHFLEDFSKYYLENPSEHFIDFNEKALALTFSVVRDVDREECLYCKSISLIKEIVSLIQKQIAQNSLTSLKIDRSNIRNWARWFLGYKETDFDFNHNEWSNYLTMGICESGRYFFDLRTSPNPYHPH